MTLDADRASQEVHVGQAEAEQFTDAKAGAREYDRNRLPLLTKAHLDALGILERWHPQLVQEDGLELRVRPTPGNGPPSAREIVLESRMAAILRKVAREVRSMPVRM